MAKNLTLLNDSSDSPLSSPSCFPASPLINQLPTRALAERILNDSESWKILDHDKSITELRFPLDSSSIEEEMAWLENELKALNSSPFSSNFVTEDLASGISDTVDPFDADPLLLEGRRTYDRFKMNLKPMQEGHTTPKPRPIDRSSPYTYGPSSGLDEATHKNEGESPLFSARRTLNAIGEEPQGSIWRLRVWHFLGRTDKTRPLMGTVHGSEPMHVLSHPSYDSSSGSTLRCGRGFHLPDDRTTNARPIRCLHGSPSAASSSTGFVPALMHRSPSTSKGFPQRRETYTNSPVVRVTNVGIRSLAAATTPPRSEVDLSQSPGAKYSADATSRLPPADTITPHQFGATDTLLNTRIATETSSSILSEKDKEINDATDVKPKRRLVIYARDSPKPVPTLPLPAVPTSNPFVTPPKDVLPKYAKANTSREGVTDSPIRRLPVVPTRSATLNFESGQSSLQVDAPFPVLLHKSAHTVRCSNTNIPGPKAPMTPRFTRTPNRVDNTPATSNPPTSLIQVVRPTRSLPCPAGPRSPHRRNDTTPTKSAGKSENNAPSTGARNVSASRVLPSH